MNKTSSILLSITLIITGFATLVFGNYIVFGIAIATNPNWNGIQASQTFTFTSNATCGDRINVTTINTAGNVVGTARFYINLTTGCSNAPENYGHTNVTFADNQPSAITNAGQNLSRAFNNNATITDVMTSSNGSTAGQVILKYNSVGRVGNNLMTLAESATNGSWSDTTLKGGTDIVAGQEATLSYASIVLPLMGLLLMIVGVVILMASIYNFRLDSGKGFNPPNSKTGEIVNTGERSSSLSDERG